MLRASTRLAISVAIVSACPSIGFAADGDLDRYRAVWEANATDNYVYSYQKYCECHRDTPPQTFVAVAAGKVAQVYHLHTNSERRVPAREGSLDLYWTVADLFELVGAAEARGVPYRVDYDAVLGYPTRVFIDYDVAAVGEEIDIRLTSFEASD